MNILKDIKAFLGGKQQYTFYFQTLTYSDSFLSLGLFLLQIFGIKVARKANELFLEEVKKSFKFKEGFLFGSARSAIYALLKSLNFSPESEVLVTGFTCEVVPNAILNAGYTPVYIDINPVNYCMDPAIVEKSITKKTKAIIIQHTYGIPAQIDELINIAQKNNLFVIEDCAVSLGSKYKGNLTGTFGDAAVFSFELSKTITSCWGGMLLLNTNKDKVIEKMSAFYKKVPEQKRIQRIRTLLQLGISGILYRPRIYLIGKYIIAMFFKFKIFLPSTPSIEKKGGLSPNYLVKLSGEQTKIVYRQYLRLDKLIEQKIRIKNKYLNELSNLLDDQFKKIASDKDVVLIRFPVLINNRSKVKILFESNKVELGFWFAAPLSSKSINHSIFNYTAGNCLNSESISRNIINLPLYALENKLLFLSQNILLIKS